MQVNKKRVGQIQIIFGVVLLIATIIASFAIHAYYIDGLVKGVKTTSETWRHVANTTNITRAEVSGHAVSSLIIESSMFRTTLPIFVLCMVILAVLSIMLILQGLVNIKE